MTKGPVQPDAGSPAELRAAQARALQGWDLGHLSSRYVLVGVWSVSTQQGRLLWVWQRQKLHTVVQVTVAVGTVTFEFPGVCMEFQLHNSATTWIFFLFSLSFLAFNFLFQ